MVLHWTSSVGPLLLILDVRPAQLPVTKTVYRHVIVPEIRGGATVMYDVFNDDEDDSDQGSKESKST